MFKRMLGRFFSSNNTLAESPPCPDQHNHNDLPDTQPHSTLIQEANLPLYTQVLSSFKQAEQFIKSVELDSNGNDLSVPSINELRYTGHHLVKAIQSDDAEKQKEELKKAYRHCKRASFDAVELGIIGKLETITIFEYDYRKSLIQNVWPDYLDSVAELEKIQCFLKHQNVTRSREDYFDSCLAHYEMAAKISQKARLARPQLNKQRNKAIRRSFIRNGAWLVTGILSTLFFTVEDKVKEELNKQTWVQKMEAYITNAAPGANPTTELPLETRLNPTPSEAPLITDK